MVPAYFSREGKARGDINPLLHWKSYTNKESPCVQVTLDMVEMVFAKADPRVSLLYEEHLCEPELHTFGDSVRRCGFLPASPIEIPYLLSGGPQASSSCPPFSASCRGFI